MWINSYFSLVNYYLDNNGELDVTKLLNHFGSDYQLDTTEEILFSFIKNGLITSYLFRIDNLFYNLLRDINCNQNIKTNFYSKYTKLIDLALDLGDRKYAKDNFTSLSYIRNSFHNNGIHRNSLYKSNIDGKIYEFKQNEKVLCSTWENILQLISNTVKVLGDILLSEKLGTSNYIIDDFANDINI